MLAEAEVDTMKSFGDAIELVPSGHKNLPTPFRARIPHVANGVMSVSAGAMRVDVQPKDFAPSKLEWSDRLAFYASVQDKVDAYRVANADGIEDFYVVEEPKNELAFSYEIRLTNVAGLRLVANTLELLDERGTPRLRMNTPTLVDAHGERRTGSVKVSGCAFDTLAVGPWGRAVTPPGGSVCTVTAAFVGRDLAYPVLVDPAWQPTANTMRQSHAYHKLLWLPAGADKDKVLLVGGTGSVPMSTELFDPATQTWAASSDLPSTLTAGGLGVGMNAAALSTGAVVAAGGFGITTATSSTAQAATVMRSATTGTWSIKAAMDARAWHVMVPTTIDGKEVVFVAGGQQSTSLFTAKPLQSTQYYDPATDNWINTGNLATGRTRARATTLSDGRILVVGGDTYTTTTIITATTEAYTPSTKSWASTGNMATARTLPELQALASGARAIVAGGSTTTSSSSAVNTLEYFDGTSWKAVTATLSSPRWQFASARMADGKLLFMGGQTYDSASGTTQSALAELFDPGSDPAMGTMVGAGAMAKERIFHAALNVPGLGVLVSGGLSGATETTGAELFNTKVGVACGTGCATGTTCVDGVCCLSPSCAAGQKCNNPGREGVCTKANGAACGGNNECASGYCVGGFCCESACAGTCKTCDATGKCINTPAGKICQGQTECGRTCDVTGTCTFTYIAAGTPCGASAMDGGTGLFCSKQACSGFSSCSTTTNNCGLTCTTTVTCNEATKSCTPTATGIKAGYCVIDSKCWSYGDINPTDSCKVCDPPTSKTSWSTAVSCMDGSVDTGVEDTGVEDTGSPMDTGSPEDTGTAGEDTGTAGEDTGTAAEDATPDATTTDELPEASTCACRTPGGSTNAAGGTLAALGIALAVAARRRRAG